MIVTCIIMSCDVEIWIIIVLRMSSVHMYEKSMRFGEKAALCHGCRDPHQSLGTISTLHPGDEDDNLRVDI